MGTRVKRLVAASILGSAVIALGFAAHAMAANTPTYRDCSFGGGLDPDFVQLMGAKPNADGLLVAPRTRKQVMLEASESPNALDQLNRVSLEAAVYRGGTLLRTVTGAARGKIVLSLPLPRPRAGRRFRIGWTARFDNGFHSCPSQATPQNTAARPFVIKVKRH